MRIESREPSSFFSGTEVWGVWSDLVADRFRICVTAPERPLAPGQRVGAVYALDGDLNAGPVAGALRQLAIMGEVPPLYAISIGYPVDHPVIHYVQRNRDLMPTPLPEFDPVQSAIFGGPVVPSGHGAKFRRFLMEELRPALDEAYPLDPGETLLTGASAGGLFTLYALLEQPASFRRYLAVSPAVWWDDRWLIRRAEDMAPFARDLSIDVHLCAGEFESHEHLQAQLRAMPEPMREAIPPFMRETDMLGDMGRMAAALRRLLPDTSSVSTAVLPNESHTSVQGAALSLGLRRLYGTLPA